MGLINFGIPKKEVKFLKELLGLDVFIEGGTYLGGTAKAMSEQFRKVYTIEKSPVMHKKAKKALEGNSNITMLKGDTREYLLDLAEQNDNILFWLDAHWSGGDTYGEDDECPLIEELKIIFSIKKNFVILIDDARCFLAPPQPPHKHKNWPSVSEIVDKIPKNWGLLIFEDVIYIFPEKVSDDFKLFIQTTMLNQTNKAQGSLTMRLFKKIRNKVVS